jgi:hypothetical protein
VLHREDGDRAKLESADQISIPARPGLDRFQSDRQDVEQDEELDATLDAQCPPAFGRSSRRE